MWGSRLDSGKATTRWKYHLEIKLMSSGNPWWAHCLGMLQRKKVQQLSIYCAGFIGSSKMKKSAKQDSSLLFINTRPHLLLRNSYSYCLNPHLWKKLKELTSWEVLLVFRRTSPWPSLNNGSILLKSGPASVNKTASLGKRQWFQDSNLLRYFLG